MIVEYHDGDGGIKAANDDDTTTSLYLDSASSFCLINERDANKTHPRMRREGDAFETDAKQFQ